MCVFFNCFTVIGEEVIDYEQSLFPNLVRRASEKKLARKIGAARKLGPRGTRSHEAPNLFFSLISFLRATEAHHLVLQQ